MSEHIVLDEAAIARTLTRLSHESWKRTRERILSAGDPPPRRDPCPRCRSLLRNFTEKRSLRRDRHRNLSGRSRQRIFCSRCEAEAAFSVEGRRRLCDDVCTRAERPRRHRSDFRSRQARTVMLLVLCDRGGREMPVSPDFVGKNIPTSSGIYRRPFREIEGEDARHYCAGKTLI